MTRLLTDAVKAEGRARYGIRLVIQEPSLPFASYADDPVGFLRDVLDVEHVWSKMVEICEAVRDSPRVSVVGGNSTSKDYTAGRLILWWLSTRRPAKVMVIGPTQRQVSGIVHREVRLGHAGALGRGHVLGGLLYRTPKWELADDTFYEGFATDDPFNLQGFHSPHLLVLVTEAHAVEGDHYEAIDRLHPERLLLTGNPLSLSGPFFESHHGQTQLYQTIRISALETPNIVEGHVVIPGMVSIDDVAAIREKWGEGSPFYVATILGQWPPELGGGLVSHTAALAAVHRTLQPGKPIVVAADIAAEGMDWTIVARRDGPVARTIYRKHYTDNLMETVGWLARYWDDHPEVERMVIDAVGLGFGVTSRLRELDYEIDEFKGGASAIGPDSDEYADRNTEAYWALRQAYVDGLIDAPEDRELVGDVTARRYILHSDRRIKLEPKAKFHKRVGRSPDVGDAYAMLWAPAAPDKKFRLRFLS